MPVIRRSRLAQQDYRDVWRYIAADNPDAADEFLRRVDAKLELYARHPLMGKNRNDLAPGLRSFSVAHYLAFYNATADGIDLVRLLHGSRPLKALLKG